jgi:IS1 family transposase/transposase-like protein
MRYAYQMIQKTITYTCRRCGSSDIVKNGTNKCGSPQYHCHACGAYQTLQPKKSSAPHLKDWILKTYHERASLRGLERIFCVARQTVSRWIRTILRTLPRLIDTLQPAHPADVLELDEVWSFVLKKRRKRWLWIALCRRTRQVVAFTIGDRSEKTCRRLWNKLPTAYKQCHAYSDFWDAYQKVWPAEQHQAVGKDTGETAHVERWNNTLRQRLARFVRKTLSFSKSDIYHWIVTAWFIIEYNLSLSLTM